MEPVIAATLVLAIIVLGEVSSTVSKARVPSLLVAVVVLFALLKTHVLPSGIIEASTVTVAGAILQPALLVHMGTLIPLRTIREQYKAVLIAVSGMLVSAVLIVAIVAPTLGYDTAVAGAGPLNGGLIAYLVTSQALKDVGATALVAVPLMILVLQGLPGMPLTSNLLRRYALKVRDRAVVPEQVAVAAGHVGEGAGTGRGPTGAAAPGDGSTGPADTGAAGTRASGLRTDRPLARFMPERFMRNPIFLLFLVFIAGSVAVGLDNLTGVSYSLWGLALGITAAWAGVLPDRVLERANGFTIAMVGLIFIVLGALTGVSLGEVVRLLPAVALIIVVGITGLVVGGWAASKAVGWDPLKGIPVALTALYGFPIDYLIAHEVSRSVGRDAEEEQAILDDILAPVLIGGFTTVTAGSVVIASLLVTTL